MAGFREVRIRKFGVGDEIYVDATDPETGDTYLGKLVMVGRGQLLVAGVDTLGGEVAPTQELPEQELERIRTEQMRRDLPSEVAERIRRGELTEEQARAELEATATVRGAGGPRVDQDRLAADSARRRARAGVS